MMTTFTQARMNCTPNINLIGHKAIGIIPDPRGCAGFMCIGYKAGGVTYIPDNLFSSWQDAATQPGNLEVGVCSSLGIGSKIKFDNDKQTVKIGNYVSIGMGVKILPGGNHQMNCLSTCQFSAFDMEMKNPDPVELGDIIIKNDVWIGDEAMIMAGAVIENGCVIGARTVIPPEFKTEPFGVYVGAPARLVKYRFQSDAIRSAILASAWWDKPFEWVKKNNELFMRAVDHELINDIALS